MLYFTSDLHLGHNKAFIYKDRGFSTIQEHDNKLIENINNIVTDEDELYILGDLMLGDNEYGISLLKQIKGKLHIIIGNHDTDARVELYKQLPNVVEVTYATIIKYGKHRFYLSHYPSHTGNFDKNRLIDLFGHTHQKTDFYNGDPLMLHVGVDSNNLCPIEIETIIQKVGGCSTIKLWLEKLLGRK